MSDSGPPPVLLPEPFLGYRCNRKGCCCGGWVIAWTAEDLARLGQILSGDELGSLFEQLLVVLADDGEQMVGARLKASEEGGRCHLLSPAGSCTLQQCFGVAALPAICADFPVVPYRMDDRIELAFRLTCPAVLGCIFASTGEVRWAELGEPDEMHAARLQRVGPPPEITVGGQPLPIAALGRLRERVLAAFDERQVPTLELLARVDWALSRVRSLQDVEHFAVVPLRDELPFVRYLLYCVRTHSSEYLCRHLARHARFVVDGELPVLDDSLVEALESWEGALLRCIEPVEPLLRPYLQRYLWLRFSSCFVHVQGELCYSFGEVTHELAIALRYLAAFCQVQDRTADTQLLQLALGAAAHLFHSHAFRFQARVWFDPEHFQSDAPPPPQVPDELIAEPCSLPVGPWDG
ncbi:MAG: hypothetical protein FJ125_04525 [Deltaproteobacteria bacterium]|nr:hypothetical protein [Deltaproteobacteria bacterium]